MGLDRQKFVDAAVALQPTVKYSENDCIGYVKLCAKKAGYTFSTSGTNDTWRNHLSSKDLTTLATIQAGDVVFRYYDQGQGGWSLPAKYRNGSDLRDVHHIGIVTKVSGNTYEVCDCRNSAKNGQKETFTSKAKLVAKWPLWGTIKNTTGSTNGAAAPVVQPTVQPVVQPTVKPVVSTTPTPVVKNGKYPQVPFMISVNVDKLNFRISPAKGTRTYGYLPKGEYMVAAVKNPSLINNWGEVYYNGHFGWINLNKKYVSWD